MTVFPTSTATPVSTPMRLFAHDHEGYCDATNTPNQRLLRLLLLLLLHAAGNGSIEHQHTNGEDDEAAELQPRPLAQTLTETRAHSLSADLLGVELVDDDGGSPHEEGTEGLQQVADDGVGVLRESPRSSLPA